MSFVEEENFSVVHVDNGMVLQLNEMCVINHLKNCIIIQVMYHAKYLLLYWCFSGMYAFTKGDKILFKV
jgi:hypothetical protein